ncbi:MAG: SDR family oxidoreductase [Defluviitaleaceae bacterium]|nr:SDR family oxidoreductase [Defluviitaleaceae bacterium]MCL2239002.1 SDR family oxidoreductase [Defluviitaleaceae bacterium]
MLTQIIPALRMLYSLEMGRLATATFHAGAQDGELTLSEENNFSDVDIKKSFQDYCKSGGVPPQRVVVGIMGVVELACHASPGGRLAGKIAIVTGSAQGFGKGIAEALAAEGVYVVIADINAGGAAECAAGLNEKYGAYRSLPVAVNVTDEASVENMVRETVLAYGGLDILISNAGVVRSGNLFELTKENFEFVTAVNYTAFFLCAKHAAAVMKRQHDITPAFPADIIEINSKSGLEGSNKNFAYAGSKFGGIGLTQSFAMECIEYGIKVNAVCPGNFLDGPLWADPVNGLFKQYLDAGKVKGAKTIADVRKYYESRVPMGRGCEIADVARAIFYAVEQQYETGQAIPVTGGQVMLK